MTGHDHREAAVEQWYHVGQWQRAMQRDGVRKTELEDTLAQLSFQRARPHQVQAHTGHARAHLPQRLQQIVDAFFCRQPAKVQEPWIGVRCAGAIVGRLDRFRLVAVRQRGGLAREKDPRRRHAVATNVFHAAGAVTEDAVAPGEEQPLA